MRISNAVRPAPHHRSGRHKRPDQLTKYRPAMSATAHRRATSLRSSCCQGAIMTFQEDIDTIRNRLAKAESDRDAWQAAGLKEKYLEAYFMVEALELQLNERL
jgi:hypothetical protein